MKQKREPDTINNPWRNQCAKHRFVWHCQILARQSPPDRRSDQQTRPICKLSHTTMVGKLEKQGLGKAERGCVSMFRADACAYGIEHVVWDTWVSRVCYKSHNRFIQHFFIDQRMSSYRFGFIRSGPLRPYSIIPYSQEVWWTRKWGDPNETISEPKQSSSSCTIVEWTQQPRVNVERGKRTNINTQKRKDTKRRELYSAPQCNMFCIRCVPNKTLACRPNRYSAKYTRNDSVRKKKERERER